MGVEGETRFDEIELGARGSVKGGLGQHGMTYAGMEGFCGTLTHGVDETLWGRDFEFDDTVWLRARMAFSAGRLRTRMRVKWAK